MLSKVIDAMNLLTGIVSVLSAIAFAICVKINDEFAMLVCGTVLLLVGGMYLASAIIAVTQRYFVKN